MKDLYIVNCCRTAIGSFGGALKNVPAVELGAITVREALKRAEVRGEWVDEVMFGGVLAVNLLNLGYIVTLVLQVLVGIVLYVGLSAIFRLTPFMALWEMLQKILFKKHRKEEC